MKNLEINLRLNFSNFITYQSLISLALILKLSSTILLVCLNLKRLTIRTISGIVYLFYSVGKQLGSGSDAEIIGV